METDLVYSVDAEMIGPDPFQFRYRKEFTDLGEAKRHALEVKPSFPDCIVSIAIIYEGGVQDRILPL